MKIKWNDKYTTISVYSFIVICLSIIFYHIVSEFTSFKLNLEEVTLVLQPFLIGFVIAYLLNFILKFIEKKVYELFPKLNPKPKRFISLFFTYLVATLFMYLFIKFIFPKLSSSFMGLLNNIPYYIKDVGNLFQDSSEYISLDEKYLNLITDKWNEFLDYIAAFTTNLLPHIASTLKSIASSILNVVLGIIVSVYLLIDKEKFFALGKKITLALFSEKVSSKILELFHRINYIFSKFISGKLLDSFIIGWLTFFILLVFKIPYPTLISFIVGVTNVIPFFGPFIGAVPSFFIVLFVSPIKALWFLVMVFLIQQVDGNIIGPKILGDSLGISAFWILFSIIVASKFLGVIGMIIGVPLFAIFYSILKDVIESKLKKKGLPSETKRYM